jgi:uncharacterized protein YcfJ
MNRIAINVLALAVSAVVGVASAQDNRYSRTVHTDRAQVIDVQRTGGPYGGDTTYERQECWNEQSHAYEGGYYRDREGHLYRGDERTNTKGMVIGALIGGAIGNTVGKGDGRTAATIAGAVVGGAIGAHTHDRDDYEYRDDRGTVLRCHTVVTTDYNGHGAYVVTYRYAGQTYQAVTNYRPDRYIDVTVDVRPRDDNGYRH